MPMNNVEAAVAEADRAYPDLGGERHPRCFTNVAGQAAVSSGIPPLSKAMTKH